MSSFNLNEFFDLAMKKSYGPNYKNNHSKYSKKIYNNIGKRPALSGKLYKVKPQKNDFYRYSYSGDIYPERQDLPAALRSNIYRNKFDYGETMRKYYKHSLDMSSNPNYVHLNKDDLAYALDLDVKKRGQAALDDYYEYERSLPHHVRNGKWHGGKFGHSTNSH